MRLQHIFKHACKYRQDSREEAELTVGILNSKLDDLSCTSDKVCQALFASFRWQRLYVACGNGGSAAYAVSTHVAGVSEVGANMAHAAYDGAAHALDCLHHHQRFEGDSRPTREALDSTRSSRHIARPFLMLSVLRRSVSVSSQP